MGIAMNRTDVLRNSLPGNGIEPALSATPIPGESRPREVLRCQHCRLVQFRTQSDMCRRCAKPLPSWIPFGVSSEEEIPQEMVETEVAETEPATNRAGRNRRVPIGAKIKEIREQRHLTQVEMANVLGIPRSYLSRIENRRLLPGPLMVAKFAEALEMDISELLPPERRRDGSRLFPNDPGLAALYTEIAKLPVPQLGRVLEMVRKMVPVMPSLPREGAGVTAGMRPQLLPAVLR